MTSLHVACQGRGAGHEAVAAAFLSAAPPADVNARAEGGVTPLHIAAFNASEAVVALLLASPGIDAAAAAEVRD